jgi:hypothetical protein
MEKQIKRKPGRPRSPDGRGKPVMLTVPRVLLVRVDHYRDSKFIEHRQDAIRELIERGLGRVQ